MRANRSVQRIVLGGALLILAHSSRLWAVVQGPLPIGVAVSQTSNVALLGQEQVIGVRLAEEYFNSKGGVGGTKIQILLEDSAADEASTINAFNALLRKNVLAIIGPTLSQQAFAADPLADKAKVPVIGPSNTAKGIPQIGNYVSRVSAPIAIVAPHALEAALKRNPQLKSVAVLFAQNDAFSTSESQTFQEAVKADKRLQLGTAQKFQTTDTDFTTQVTEVMKVKPDLVIISGLAADGGNLVKQLRQLGYKGLIIGGNGLNTPNVFPVCQKYCDGILIAQAYSPEAPDPMNKVLVDLYQKKHKKMPGQFTAQAFTAVQVVVEALNALDQKKKITSYDLKDLRQDLNKQILSQSYQTPLGAISFDKDGEIVQKSFYVAEIKMEADNKNGTFAFLK
ncbi:MAG TPA: ABC transporter substrate-binding protein [Oligoflexus sp.]|uniref:ABC transporter substrate-binding protein n=1 Tax=Oligoflexus sp. TaxID=1971216 RepID=UPI002D7E87A0|nr:ABC transporter substrate-binding protein [Oligoflexus sp.]HET9241315.1 ABC transporter substrate-binding protein [Oligoflexus sp.]